MRTVIELFKNFPIQRKINLAILLTCATALAVTAAAIFVAQLVTFRHGFRRDLAAIGQMIGQNTAAAVTFKDHKGAEDILGAVSAKPHILRAAIELPDGSEFAAYTGGLIMAPEVPGGDGFHFVGPYLVLNQPVVLAGERIATLCLVSDYQAEYGRSLRLYLLILGGALLVSVLLALLLSNRLQRLISAPMLELAATAHDVAEKQDYTLRAPALYNDEVGELTRAFNQMLTRIQAQDEALRLSQGKLEALVHSLDGIVWESTADTFQFTFVSRQSERLLGYRPEEWLASPTFWQDHLHPEDATRAIETCHRAVAARQPYTYEYRMLAADGQTVWIRESGVVLVEGDQASGVRGILMDITAQKEAAEQLDKLNRRLMDTSRLAGMSEVATGVLHNVGNVLNSVNVSVSVISEQLGRSQAGHLGRISGLLEAHRGELASFLTSDPKGRRVPELIAQLAAALGDERAQVTQEVQSLQKNIEHIKEIVAMQQSYAKVAGLIEDLPVEALVEDAIRMNAGALQRHGVNVRREFGTAPVVRVDKHKVLQILVNLFRNAKYALEASGRADKVLSLGIGLNGGGKAEITVSDNGVGISPEDLTRIFGHGFTTKKEGHGFGLHSGALAAKELGGSLRAASEGPGKGATFILELPLAPPGRAEGTMGTEPPVDRPTNGPATANQ